MKSLSIMQKSEKNLTLLSKNDQLEHYRGDSFDLRLTGFDNYEKVYITVDKKQKVIMFSFARTKTPPEHFPEKTYAFIRYLDAMGVEKYRYEFIKSNKGISPPQARVFILTPEGGERLFLYHKEGGERVEFNYSEKNNNIPIEMKEVEITYQFTGDGLLRLPSGSPEALTLSGSLLSPPENLGSRAIAAPLPQSEISNLSEKYSSLVPKTNQLESYKGNSFNLKLTGFNNYETVFIDLYRPENTNRKVILFSFIRKPELLPENFPEKTYAFIRYLDATGVEKYRCDFVENKQDIPPLKPAVFFLTPQGGERLFIYHKDGGEQVKLTIPQGNKNIPIEMKEVEITYKVTADGLQRLPSDSPEHLTLADSFIQPLAQSLASSTITSESSYPLEDFRNRAIAATELLAAGGNSLFNRSENC